MSDGLRSEPVDAVGKVGIAMVQQKVEVQRDARGAIKLLVAGTAIVRLEPWEAPYLVLDLGDAIAGVGRYAEGRDGRSEG